MKIILKDEIVPLPYNPFHQTVLRDIEYKDYAIRVTEATDTGYFIQIVFVAKDSVTGEIGEQRSRKWYMSKYQSETEIVRSVWLAIKQAEIHEMEETFKYCGRAPYNSHIKMTSLWGVAQDFQHRDKE